MCNVLVGIIAVVMIIMFCSVHGRRIKRVVGGVEVPCGLQPRVGSLRNASTLQHLCGATLLSTEFALTTAHCVTEDAQQYVIYLNNICEGNNLVQVLEVFTHPLYDTSTQAHDIAVIRVSLNIDDTSWLNDCILPTSAFGLSGDCMIYGYGTQERQASESSWQLLAGPLQIVSLDKCEEALGPYAAPQEDSGMLCALGDGVDSCQGDSGGPLMCSDKIQAISSYGISCAVPHMPAVYTSVGPHVTWIRSVVGNNRITR